MFNFTGRANNALSRGGDFENQASKWSKIVLQIDFS